MPHKIEANIKIFGFMAFIRSLGLYAHGGKISVMRGQFAKLKLFSEHKIPTDVMSLQILLNGKNKGR